MPAYMDISSQAEKYLSNNYFLSTSIKLSNNLTNTQIFFTLFVFDADAFIFICAQFKLS